MQTDPNDVIKGLNLIENFSSKDKLLLTINTKGEKKITTFFSIKQNLL